MVKATLAELESRTLGRIAAAKDAEELEAVRIDVLGRKGALAQISKEMGKLQPEERARIGKLLNSAKQALETAFEAKQGAACGIAASNARLEAEWIDLTAARARSRPGSLHPMTQIQHELEDLFTSLGFTVLDGPEVETEYSQLRRAEHSRRTIPRATCRTPSGWTAGSLLRTHTSPVQVRGMERLGPPLRMIAPGRVFRNEEVDAVARAHLLPVGRHDGGSRSVGGAPDLLHEDAAQLALPPRGDGAAASRLLSRSSSRVSSSTSSACICGGTGCPVCKQSGWVEQLGCGLVHPNVLRMSGLDPEEWNGFAFGLGLTRLAMMRYGIDDIRLLQSGDLRFLKQF